VALFAASATPGRRQPVVAPRPVMLGAAGDVGPLGMACHGFGSCRGMPIPIGVKSLTPGLSFYICGGWRQCGPLSEGDRAPLGSGGAELPFLGLGETRPAPKESNESNLCPWGRVNRNLSPIVGDH
jgi:hypothetical protein